MNSIAARLREISGLQPTGPRVRAAPISEPDEFDIERKRRERMKALHADPAFKAKMKALHADPAFEKKRITALQATFEARRGL